MNIYDPSYQAFLEKLQSARKQAGLTQVQAAERLSKPQSFVSKSESGERRVDFVEAVRFAKLYGKKITFFVP